MNYRKLLSPSQYSIARCYPVMTQEILRRNTGSGQTFHATAEYPYVDEVGFYHWVSMVKWSERVFWGGGRRGVENYRLTGSVDRVQWTQQPGAAAPGRSHSPGRQDGR